jgi:hypothetical protein
MTAATAAPPRTADLVLIRLLPVPPDRKPPAASDVRKQLSGLLPEPLSGESFDAVRQELVGAGLVEPKALRLTDAGRAKALAVLGVEQLPPRTTWKTLQARYLFPLAAGVPADAQETRDRLRRSDHLAGFLLKQHYGLPSGPATTLSATLGALACRKLGFPKLTDPKLLTRAVLSRMLESDRLLTVKEIQRVLPAKALGAPRPGTDELRRTVVRRWLADSSVPAEAKPTTPAPERPGRDHPAEFDLPAFAATVRRVARDCPTGRFGDNKVFISHVWRRFREESNVPVLNLPEFKQRLVEANRSGLVRLSTADLVEAMDPADVGESSTQHLNANYHFILIEEGMS